MLFTPEQVAFIKVQNEIIVNITSMIKKEHKLELRIMAAKALLGDYCEAERFKILIEKFYEHNELVETKQIVDSTRMFKAPRAFERCYYYWKNYYDYNLSRNKSLNPQDLGSTLFLFFLWVQLEYELRKKSEDVKLEEILNHLYKQSFNEEFNNNQVNRKVDVVLDKAKIEKLKSAIKDHKRYKEERQSGIMEIKKLMLILREKSLDIRNGTEMKDMVDKYMLSIPHIIRYNPRRNSQFKESKVVKKPDEVSKAEHKSNRSMKSNIFNNGNNNGNFSPGGVSQRSQVSQVGNVSQVSQVSRAGNVSQVSQISRAGNASQVSQAAKAGNVSQVSRSKL